MEHSSVARPRAVTRNVWCISLTLTFAAGGCTRWVAAPPPGPMPETLAIAKVARLELVDGRMYEVRNLTIRGDSLFAENAVREGERVALPSRDVKVIRSREVTWRPVWVGVGIFLLLGLLGS